MTDNLDINEIQKLQDFYLKFCEDNLLNDEKISSYCKEAETEIKNNYEDLYENTTRKNLISTPFERIVTFHIINHFVKKKINVKLVPSIISSDLIFELDNCFLNIDCKTVNIITNWNDAKDISVSPNQMTFSCHPQYKVSLSDGKVFSGFHYEGKQKPDIMGKPNFTFMFKLVYADNFTLEEKRLDVPGKNVSSINNALKIFDITKINKFKKRSYKNLALALAVVPNGHLVDEYFLNNGMQGFKNYEYITSEKNYPSKYKPLSRKKSHWKEIKLKEYFPGTKGPTKTIYLDTRLKHPHYSNENAVWGLLDKKYCIMLGGDSGRINRELTIFKSLKL